ncbi:MAG: hypothetical protein ACRCV9_00875 [Burkholderiaceae bacterium]
MDALLVFVHVLVCSAGILVCICRAGVMGKRTTKRVVRFQYVMWPTALVSLMLSPISMQVMASSACITAALLSSVGAWRAGLPGYAKRSAFADTVDLTSLFGSRKNE